MTPNKGCLVAHALREWRGVQAIPLRFCESDPILCEPLPQTTYYTPLRLSSSKRIHPARPIFQSYLLYKEMPCTAIDGRSILRGSVQRSLSPRYSKGIPTFVYFCGGL